MVITPEQRRLGGIKSGVLRREAKAELETLRAIVAKLSVEPVPEPKPEPIPELREGYILDRLVRVRKQIEQLDEMLEGEADPQKLDRLASAIGRLSEIERQLANRPLPGSLKPSSPSRRQQQRIEPLPDEPACGPGPTTAGVQPACGIPKTPQEPK